MERNKLFTYSWHVDKLVLEQTIIRVYGLDINNKNICIRVTGFTPYIYLELPTNLVWNSTKIQALGEAIDKLILKDSNNIPITKELCMMHKMYGAHIDSEGKRKKFPYMRCAFANKEGIEQLARKLRSYPIHVVGIGSVRLFVHEQTADPVLQFTTCRNLPVSGWVQFKGTRVAPEDQLTRCDLEYTVFWTDTLPYNCEILARPLIMAYDIEANSSNPARMPKSTEEGDKVFQISCVFCRYGDKPNDWIPYLLSLGDPDPKIVNSRQETIIRKFETEGDLLVGFVTLINELNPNILAGFNLLGFDIQYMVERAKREFVYPEFSLQGFHRYQSAPLCSSSWSSSAFSNQEYVYLDLEGRVTVDLLPLVKRDFGKLDNYKLNTIAGHFYGDEHKKDPLPAKAIFKCYEEGMKKKGNLFTQSAKKHMGICGKYCVQDSLLVLRLMDTLETWVGLTEMAKTCNIPMWRVYTEGQQVRVYAQIYKYAMNDNTVVEKDGYIPAENERYMGAYVFTPVPGIYDDICPLDFKSLYPCTIIAYNIDYTTMVLDNEEGNKIPDSMCHVMEWEDHSACEHDPLVIRVNQLSQEIAKKKLEAKEIRAKKNALKVSQFYPSDIMDYSPADRKLQREFAKKKFNNTCKKLTQQARRLENSCSDQQEEKAELKSRIKDHVMCEKRKYRWLKEPKGILPNILEELLAARSRTRKRQKTIKESTDPNDQTLWKVLEQRQLSYKVCSNSIYGALGVRSTRYLPLIPAAMCTTYMGRQNIKLAAKVCEQEHKGCVTYGDTDSILVSFSHCKSTQETWDYAEKVAAQITKLYPPPMELEFEDAIYKRYLILKKKQYVYSISDREGNISSKIGKKGVILARRDNCDFVRKIYQQTIQMIFDKHHRDDILFYVLNEIRKLFSKTINIDQFVITQSIKSTGNLSEIRNMEDPINDYDAYITTGKDANGKICHKIGDYKIKTILSQDENKRKEQMKKKNATDVYDFYVKSLGAAVQLGEKLKRRGQRADAGSRLEFVICEVDNSFKVSERIECADYYRSHCDILKLDMDYYLGKLATPLDKVLNVIYAKQDPIVRNVVNKKTKMKTVMYDRYEKNMIHNLTKRYADQRKLINEFKSLHKPIIKWN